jgi:glutamate--cysteine ligase
VYHQVSERNHAAAPSHSNSLASHREALTDLHSIQLPKRNRQPAFTFAFTLACCASKLATLTCLFLIENFPVPQSFSQRLQLVTSPAIELGPQHILRGIEKESLRINPQGRLAQTPHPPCLGAALTNTFITTDYSEALLEFITPTHHDIDSLLNCLDDTHRFVYPCLQQELLWTASMPCILRGNEDIPVARYGSSNIGNMKNIYRIGLGLRYGRAMQTIAGIHYNFSLSDQFWQRYQQGLSLGGDLQAFKNDQYLGMIRNFRRYSWLLSYLFGASPALCKSFLGKLPHTLDTFGENTLYLPHATSLRMGKLGYQSSAQENLIVSYDSLDGYISSLQELLTRRHVDYENTGTHNAAGEWQQLSTSLLQIENEFYSSIRPKQPVESGEAPLKALMDRGIEYIEIRALDVNPFLPLGIDAEEVRFLDLFLLYCLLQPSPPLEAREYQQSQHNLAQVVNAGRAPTLHLENGSQTTTMKQWARTICTDLTQLATQINDPQGEYKRALHAQQVKIENSSLTPSGRILDTMQERDITWFDFAMKQSLDQAKYFLQRPLDSFKREQFAQAASESLASQDRLEAEEESTFDDFLRDFYSQYR